MQTGTEYRSTAASSLRDTRLYVASDITNEVGNPKQLQDRLHSINSRDHELNNSVLPGPKSIKSQSGTQAGDVRDDRVSTTAQGNCLCWRRRNQVKPSNQARNGVYNGRNGNP